MTTAFIIIAYMAYEHIVLVVLGIVVLFIVLEIISKYKQMLKKLK